MLCPLGPRFGNKFNSILFYIDTVENLLHGVEILQKYDFEVIFFSFEPLLRAC